MTEWSGGGRAHNGRRPDQTESCKACRHGGLLPDCRCCGKVAFPSPHWRPCGPASRWRWPTAAKANPEKSKPSGQPEPPSSSLGSALAIFSVPGPTWPRPDGGAFFVRRNRCVTRNRIGAAAVHERVSLRPIGVGLHDDGIKLRVAHLRYMTRSFVASADWTTPGRKPI